LLLLPDSNQRDDFAGFLEIFPALGAERGAHIRGADNDTSGNHWAFHQTLRFDHPSLRQYGGWARGDIVPLRISLHRQIVFDTFAHTGSGGDWLVGNIRGFHSSVYLYLVDQFVCEFGAT
jgi:hypothetical protein